jgi:hypothetical protein
MIAAIKQSHAILLKNNIFTQVLAQFFPRPVQQPEANTKTDKIRYK